MKKLGLIITAQKIAVAAILTMTVLSFAKEPGSDWDLYGSVRLNAAQWQRGHWYTYPIDTATGIMDTTSDEFEYDSEDLEDYEVNVDEQGFLSLK